jgi:hypothetical protein
VGSKFELPPVWRPTQEAYSSCPRRLRSDCSASPMRTTGIRSCGSCVVFRACRRVRAQWDPAASSSAGKCEDDDGGPAILALGAELGGTRMVVGSAGITASSWVQTSVREGLATLSLPTSSSSSPPNSPSRPGL